MIASKEGDLETAKAQLRSAVGKDSALAEKAAKDVNLSNLFASGFKGSNGGLTPYGGVIR
ncbi:MAG: hypothetical protein L6V80_05160 [Bacteroidales bacterium]|nr:MAG: hypothetical protein L6V80_05160 [Bacteroidales bacterium]